MQGPPPAPFPPHINCNNSYTGHGPQALPAELGEGERVTNLLFFFLYFHYHQIWDECYFCKTQHKKKFTIKRLVNLRYSILPHHPSKRPSQPWCRSEQQSCRSETLSGTSLGTSALLSHGKEPDHTSPSSLVLPEPRRARPTLQSQSQHEVAQPGLAEMHSTSPELQTHPRHPERHVGCCQPCSSRGKQ